MVELPRYPLNTEPKLPPPNFSEKALVARCKLIYRNATTPMPPSGFCNVRVNHFPFLLQSISRRIIKNKVAVLAPMAKPLIFLFFFFSEPGNSFAARRM
ncbi:Os04g0420801 [Oryza sativa Japonica Group]|uniref:Os04g0420801 protein n=1 Tax=Oryza sativa subsp. japonica TaxID=39947 RepID=A0A0P0WAC0_ORYSJ|nr:Os04g0420801 [Oryza sativa Japonica Group]